MILTISFTIGCKNMSISSNKIEVNVVSQSHEFSCLMSPSTLSTSSNDGLKGFSDPYSSSRTSKRRLSFQRQEPQ